MSRLTKQCVGASEAAHEHPVADQCALPAELVRLVVGEQTLAGVVRSLQHARAQARTLLKNTQLSFQAVNT